MQRCEITPYEGTMPYIFVSYAHRDSALVFPILEELDRRGYRLWYDDGIAPGSEWPENIAQHLSDAAVILACISPNSMASDNCRREVTFALAKKKAFLGAILQPTQMSLGMEMQLSAQQCVMKYTYTSEEAFLRKLCSCPEFGPCRKLDPKPEQPPQESKPDSSYRQTFAPGARQTVVTPPKPPQESKPDSSYRQTYAPGARQTVVTAPPKQTTVPPKQTAAPPKQTAVPPKQTTVPPKQATASPKQPPVQAKPVSARQSKKAAKGKAGKVVLAILAAFVLLCLLCYAIDASNTVDITDDLQAKKDDYSLYLFQETVDQAMVEKINLLEAMESLTFAECTFTPGALAVLEPQIPLFSLRITDCSGVDTLAFLQGQSELYSLTLEGSDVTDPLLSDLSLPNLSELDLKGCAGVTDLGFLANCTKLRDLDISLTGVTDLDDLAGLQLTSLSFDGTAVSSVLPLAGMTGLSFVHGGSTQVSSIDALAGLTELRTLSFPFCPITQIGQEFQALRLEFLYLGYTGLTDLSAFANCTVLREVSIPATGIADIAFLEKNAATLTMVNLSGCPLTRKSVEFLCQSPELTRVFLDGIPMTDLNMLTGASKLTELSAVSCGLEDISGISGCTALTKIYLGNNRIGDISPLNGLTSTNSIRLDLSCNPITDLSGLPQVYYTFLGLVGEGIPLDTLPTLEGNHVALTYADGMENTTLGENTFSNYHILGCPADRQVALEDALYAWRVDLVPDSSHMAEVFEKESIPAGYLRQQ